MAFMATSVLVLFCRGPHETRWVGWGGGAQLKKRTKLVDLSPNAITEGAAFRQSDIGMVTRN